MLWNGKIYPYKSIFGTNCTQRQKIVTKFTTPQRDPAADTTNFIKGRLIIIPMCVLTSAVWCSWKLRQSLPSGHQCTKIIERKEFSSQKPTQSNSAALSPVTLKAKQWTHGDHTRCHSGNHGLLLTSAVVLHHVDISLLQLWHEE